MQTASENKRVIARFLRAAVRNVFGDIAVHRGPWHTRENVVSSLAKQDQGKWRRTIEDAYAHATYDEAKHALERLLRELRVVNESAAASLA